ncbi:MAG: DUF4838 domain-containing protein [Treponema sp.]|nr:DUF4838 domain-containing protein [Treponema sp.]
MKSFDAAKLWEILIPAHIPAAVTLAQELSRCVGLLRQQAGALNTGCPVKDSESATPDDAVPFIVLNAEKENRVHNGYSWRLGKERVELYGESDRGLSNAVFDFLEALGFRWPSPDTETLPRPYKTSSEYRLDEDYAYHPSNADSLYRRLLFPGKDAPEIWEKEIVWAARNRIDALVFSLHNQVIWNKLTGLELKTFLFFFKKQQEAAPSSPIRDKLLTLAEQYALSIEMGGWDLTWFLPRSNFKRHQDMFRLDDGKRDREHNFCATNSDTLNVVKEQAEKLFRLYPEIRVFHLWPARGYEKRWCACPTCRAFTLEEQNRIAVNTIADVLRAINAEARISYFENSSMRKDIAVRNNLFVVSRLPGETNAEAGGWFLKKSEEH